MTNQINRSQQQLTSSLTNTIENLSTSLQAISPTDNQTVRLITYTLVATAITGIFVYHYIKNQEN